MVIVIIKFIIRIKMRKIVYYKYLIRKKGLYEVWFKGLSAFDLQKYFCTTNVKNVHYFQDMPITSDDDLPYYLNISNSKFLNEHQKKSLEADCCLILEKPDEKFCILLEDIFDINKMKEVMKNIKLIFIAYDYDWGSCLFFKNKEIVLPILKYLSKQTQLVYGENDDYYE